MQTGSEIILEMVWPYPKNEDRLFMLFGNEIRRASMLEKVKQYAMEHVGGSNMTQVKETGSITGMQGKKDDDDKTYSEVTSTSAFSPRRER